MNTMSDIWDELTIARTMLSLTQTICMAGNANDYSELEPYLNCVDHKIESIMLSMENLNSRNSYEYWRRKLQVCLHFYMQLINRSIMNSLD